MTALFLPADYSRIKVVQTFEALVTTAFEDGINALCWPRTLPGDSGEVVALLGAGEGIVTLDKARLASLPVSAAGRAAIDVLLEDQQRLREHARDPVLNCIYDYPRDEEPGPVRTDVFSFHADSAPVEADTWLCTYHGLPSEGLRNDEAQRRVDLPTTRAELLQLFGAKMMPPSTNTLPGNATTCTTPRPCRRGPSPSAWGISGASPSIGPAASSRPASIARRKRSPASRRGCC